MHKTIATEILGRPLNQMRNIGSTPIKYLAESIRDYVSKPSLLNSLTQETPHISAVRFYLLEHAVGTLRARRAPDEPLNAGEHWLTTVYNTESLRMATRAFYYCLLICTRETRHCGSNNQASRAQTASQVATTLFPNDPTRPAEILAVLNTTADTADIDAITTVMLAAGSKFTVEQYLAVCREVFNQGLFHGGYGGKPWGVVAECTRAFAAGEVTAAMMLDTVWTLEHNNGTIFNKNMLYNNLQRERLLEILDVQRAGMIPQYVRTTSPQRNYVADQEMLALAKNIGDVLGAPFDVSEPTFDWQAVVNAGANQHYGHYGATKAPKKKAAVVQSFAGQQPLATLNAAQATPAFKVDVAAIAPGVTVQKAPRHA